MTWFGGWAGRMRFARKRPKSQVITDRSMKGFVTFCISPMVLLRVLDKSKEAKIWRWLWARKWRLKKAQAWLLETAVTPSIIHNAPSLALANDLDRQMFSSRCTVDAY